MARFSDTLMEHFQSPRNAGRLQHFDIEGRVGSPDHPPFMILQLRLDHEVVTDAKFQTYGCGVAIACGSAITELIIGQKIDDCLRLVPADVERSLDGLPDDRSWCGELAVNAVRNAINQWRNRAQ